MSNGTPPRTDDAAQKDTHEERRDPDKVETPAEVRELIESTQPKAALVDRPVQKPLINFESYRALGDTVVLQAEYPPGLTIRPPDKTPGQFWRMIVLAVGPLVSDAVKVGDAVILKPVNQFTGTYTAQVNPFDPTMYIVNEASIAMVVNYGDAPHIQMPTAKDIGDLASKRASEIIRGNGANGKRPR